MLRTLQPELLDSLPPEHPDARRSRRDLRLINRLMGNHRWFARTLPRLLRSGERVVELGAGMGELGRRLATQGITVDGLDFVPRPADWPVAHAWHTSDLRSFRGYAAYPVVIANLILHHLSAGELASLGVTLSRTARVIVACEPKRSAFSQRLFACLGPVFRANHITRHDAHVSIAAGFRADELPRALGLHAAQWDCRCSTTALGAYRMVASRRA
jgi:2-polyprenyl-3-methyl-5-hydroxy-6-metoxy-1,4-benzoquinol methylase